jgi:WD40 repeat protein/serine/threonine protein kinase/tetratricopeptide (TPR) repeat protein
MRPNEGRVEEIFGNALEIESTEKRAAYLANACGEDAALRKAVESLLNSHARAGDFLEKPAMETEALGNGPVWSPEGPGTLIGPYKLIEPIGEGAFAAVYRAEQLEPVRREVALKVLKAGVDTREVIARFEAERQALAIMCHPNIARVFDAGATQNGRPYFAMELVSGEPITAYCDRHQLDPIQRLELFIQVCQGVQHAHQKGIIHRDLKPTNVLVMRQDERAVPKVIDFGVAKALSRPLTEMTLFTRYGELIGTPPYISPEQADAHQENIDIRTDIYGLGALLYELLTGSPPFDPKRLREAGFAEILRILREEEPPKPSTQLSRLGERLGEVARNRQAAPAALPKLVHGDLDWIVMKALEKDRRRRYETADGLARDIERHLNHEAVLAAAPSMIYRLEKLVRRNRYKIASLSLAALALVVGLLVSTIGIVATVSLATVAMAVGLMVATIGFVRAQRERSRAEAAEQDALTQRDAAMAARAQIEEERDRAVTRLTRQQLDRGLRRLEQGDSFGLLDLIDARLTANEVPLLRNTTARLWSIAATQVEGRLLHVFGGDSHLLLPERESMTFYRRNSDLAFSPDGKLIARGWGSAVWMWDVCTGCAHGMPAELNENIDSLAFSPDGSLLAVGTTGDGTDQDIVGHVLDTSTGLPTGFSAECMVTTDSRATGRASCGHRGAVAFSFRGDFLAMITSNKSNKTIEIRDTQCGELLGTYPMSFTLPNHFGATFSADGKLLAVVSCRNVQIWDIATGKPHGPPLAHPGWGVQGAFFTRAGDRLLTHTETHGIFVWDLATAQSRQLLPRLDRMNDGRGWYERVREIEMSSDERLLAAGMENGKIRLVEFATGRHYDEHQMEHRAGVTAVRFSPDGSLLATSSMDGTVCLWEVESGRRYGNPLYHGEEVATIAFSPEGEHLASLTIDGTVRIWHTLETPRYRAIPLPGDTKVDVAFSADGKLLGTAVPGTFQNEPIHEYLPLWDTTTWKPYHRWPVLPEGAIICGARFSADGRWIAISGTDGVVRLWNTSGEQFDSVAFSTHGDLTKIAFSPDTAQIAGVSMNFRSWGAYLKVQIWNLANAKPLWQLVTSSAAAESVVFSPDGRLVAILTASDDFCIFDMTTGQLIKRIALGDVAIDAAFSPDGKSLAIATLGSKVQLWQVDTDQEQLELVGVHTQGVGGVAYSPAGDLLASASRDGSVRLWAVELGPPWLSLVLRYPAPLSSVAFSPGGGLLATGSEFDSTAWVGNLPPPSDLREMQLRTWLALGVRHDPNGNVHTIGWQEWPRLREELKHLQRNRIGTGVDVWPQQFGEDHAWLDRYKSAVGHMKDAWKLAPYGKIEELKVALGRARTLLVALAEEFPDIEAYPILVEHNSMGAIWYRRGQALGEQEGWVKALPAFSEAAELGFDPNRLKNLAWDLAMNSPDNKDDIQVAVTLAKRAIAATSNSASIWNTLGVACYQAELWDEAIEALEKSVELGSSDEESFDSFFLAMAYWQFGEQEKAQQWYERAAQWMEKNLPEHVVLIRLRREAISLLGITETAAVGD